MINDEDSVESIEDVEVYSCHYRFGLLNFSDSPERRVNREQLKYHNEGKIISLAELAAQKVASYLPFGHVERFVPPVPEPMQCRIAFWSFPQGEEDIRLYTCLANGNADVFYRAEYLISLNCVCDMLQVGFHLSANVKHFIKSDKEQDFWRVAITFDRRRITSCSCSCSSDLWCQHAVAVCLQRIRKPQEVILRAPVSESLQRLEKNQLQKFAQYLINELPQQILPAAQRLLDELLSGEDTEINIEPAAPDPTAGATINEQTRWCLADNNLSEDIRKILLKQCSTQPTVYSDIQALHTTPPVAVAEYSQLLRPIRGREPEGLWNLIAIVGEMMKRRDSNFFRLLQIMTDEVMKCDQVVSWWFVTKISFYSGSTIHSNSSKNSSQCTSQYSCSNFCDEIVHLWRLAAMDPSSNTSKRKKLFKKFFAWHLEILEKHKGLVDGPSNSSNNMIVKSKRNLLELFPGFKPSMEGCLIEWNDWDEKKDRIVTAVEQNETEKVKSGKSGKKKRKKSKFKRAESNLSIKTSEISQDSKKDLEQGTEATEQVANPSVEVLNSPAVPENDQLELNHENVNENERSDERHEGLQREPLQELSQNRRQKPAPIRPIWAPFGPDLEPELQVYFMEHVEEDPAKPEESESLSDFIKVNPRKLKNPLETLYAKTEGLSAHGHLEESHKLALRVAKEILSLPDYPSLKQLYFPMKRRKKKGSLDNQMSIVASESLSKITFLCNVLLSNPDDHPLVFMLVMFGLEMKRSPASTKPLEVKLINQKHDLIKLLKTISLRDEELKILREKAQALRDGTYHNESDALATLILGNYIFEALVLSKSNPFSNSNQRPPPDSTNRQAASLGYGQPGGYPLEEHYIQQLDMNQPQVDQMRQPQCSLIVHGKTAQDSCLGFHAALAAMSVKVTVLENDHPLLCEGIRRQRGELALSLLTYYKDDQEKLDLILKNLLDQDALSPPNPTSGAIQVADTVPNVQPSPANGTIASSTPTKSPSKKNGSSQDTNQPSEASSHFMFELAKTVFDKAGGSITTAHLFRPQLITQNGGRGIHRRLHMCALRIALYSLGLQNRTSVNWMLRTYNGRASFIHEQAIEIGLPAIEFLCENWEGYLTPVELSLIADKASCSNDPETKRVAAKMAISCLKHANYLDHAPVRRMLAHCKDQNISMLKDACNQIERVADVDSVCADVLFVTARSWFGLYEKSAIDSIYHGDESYIQRDSISKEPVSQLDNGASGWHDYSGKPLAMDNGEPHQDKYQQLMDPLQLLHLNMNGRPEDIPTVYALTSKQTEYAQRAYRVGIKALESLKLSIHTSTKHSSREVDDVLWLLGLSKALGIHFLNNFVCTAIRCIINANVLHMIISDLIEFFGTIPDHYLSLVDKCLERYVKQTRELMIHPSHDQRNYIEQIFDIAQFLTSHAKTFTCAFYFKELLKIVESQSCKRLKKSRFIIDTRIRHNWLDQIHYQLRDCSYLRGCSVCDIGAKSGYLCTENGC